MAANTGWYTSTRAGTAPFAVVGKTEEDGISWAVDDAPVSPPDEKGILSVVGMVSGASAVVLLVAAFLVRGRSKRSPLAYADATAEI